MNKEAMDNTPEKKESKLTRRQKISASIGHAVTTTQVEWANTKVGFRKRLVSAGLILAAGAGLGGLLISSSEAQDNECSPNDNGCVPGSTVPFPEKGTTPTSQETTSSTTTSTIYIPPTTFQPPITSQPPTTLQTPEQPNAETAMGGNFEEDGNVYNWTAGIAA